MQDYEHLSIETASISQRLRQVASVHEACLSNLSSLTTASQSKVASKLNHSNGSNHTNDHNKQNDITTSTTKETMLKRGVQQKYISASHNDNANQEVGIGGVALRRSMCTSLDGGGAASSAYTPDSSAVSFLSLNPSERVAPSRIVPGIETASTIENKVVCHI